VNNYKRRRGDRRNKGGSLYTRVESPTGVVTPWAVVDEAAHIAGLLNDWGISSEEHYRTEESQFAGDPAMTPQVSATPPALTPEECKAVLPAEQAWELLAYPVRITESECAILADVAGGGEQAIVAALDGVIVPVRITRVPSALMELALEEIYGPRANEPGAEPDDSDAGITLRILDA